MANGPTGSAFSAVSCKVSSGVAPGKVDTGNLEDAVACCLRWSSLFNAGWAISERRCFSDSEIYHERWRSAWTNVELSGGSLFAAS